MPPPVYWPPPQAPYQGPGTRRPESSRFKLIAAVEAVAIVGLAVALVASLVTRPSGHSSGANATGPAAVGGSGGQAAQVPPTSAPPPSTAGTVVYHSSFAVADGWNTGPIGTAQASFATAGWTVTASNRIHHVLTTPYLNHSRRMSVAATVKGYPDTNVSFGTGCQADPDTQLFVYQFIAYPNGEWYLEKVQPNRSVATVERGTASPLPDNATVEIACTSAPAPGGATTTSLVGYINGQAEVQTSDTQTGLPAAGWIPVLLMDSYGSPVSVTYTSMSVRNLAAGAG